MQFCLSHLAILLPRVQTELTGSKNASLSALPNEENRKNHIFTGRKLKFSIKKKEKVLLIFRQCHSIQCR